MSENNCPVDIMTSKISLLNLVYDNYKYEIRISEQKIEEKLRWLKTQKKHFKEIGMFLHSWRENRKIFRKLYLEEIDIKAESSFWENEILSYVDKLMKNEVDLS